MAAIARFLLPSTGRRIKDEGWLYPALPISPLQRFGFRISAFGFRISLLALACFTVTASRVGAASAAVLDQADFAPMVSHFNTMEPETVTNLIPNAGAWDWLQSEIPLFACPDPEVQELYYFRWWSFRKHLEKTDSGYVFSEFLTRPGPVSSALGHHLMEGRWLHDQNYLDAYVRYWLQTPASLTAMHKYSSWLAYAVYQRSLVTGDRQFPATLLDDLVGDYRRWEQEHLTTNGLYWQYDVRDAMEESISGSRTNKNLRPSINSYMFGNAQAIAAIARQAGNDKIADEFDAKATRLRQLIQAQLWNADASFFEVRRDNGSFSGAREEIGFIPWYFELPENRSKYAAAWAQFSDPQGFSAPYGITTAERRHPLFRTHGVGHCEWDGAVWPFATSQTLTALANFLRDYKAVGVGPTDYFNAFLTYTHSQHAAGRPYIGEYLDETTGEWINGKNDRSPFYNHSTYADLLITGVVGLRPRADETVEVWPLLPTGVWNWFCLDDVNYHGRQLTILWDQDGSHYHRGPGLTVLAGGKSIAHADKLGKLTAKLP
jgi:hypothetical protein